MVIYTDYSLLIQISKKSNIIITINTAKLNLKLVLTIEFIFMFSLNIKHKINKNNIIPNTLSKLLYIKNEINDKKDNKGELEALFV